MYPILYPLVLATLGAGASAEEAVKPPSGPQPHALLARMKEDGSLTLREAVAVPVTRMVRKTVVQDGVARAVVVQMTEFVTTFRLRTVAGKDVQGYDTSGKKVDADTVRRRLNKDTPVLISVDGKPVDPFYLKLIRPGTLVLVIPSFPNGGAGNPIIAPTPRGLPQGEPVKKLPKD